MRKASDGAPYWDPYDQDIYRDPYPFYRRLREEAPLYYNDKYDFYAVSRIHDVELILGDRETYGSARGSVLDFMKMDIKYPPGLFINEDPPTHTMYRGLVSKVFTPARMAALDAQIREFCAKSLDPLRGTGKFDFVEHLGSKMPMRVIGMLLGIPESDIFAVQRHVDDSLRTEPGQPTGVPDDGFMGDMFKDYLEWRVKHPSDDLMTQFMNTEFVDDTGTKRKLRREEVLVMTNMLAGAGNETTNRLIGWTGMVLGDHPDQRRDIVNDRSLVTQAVEELLRYEPPGGAIARLALKDIELYGTKIPAGSAMVCVAGAANRDESRFENGDSFNIHRIRRAHLTFGYGFHVCVGNALARVEGRIALNEILDRFPEWEVDKPNAKLVPSSTTRGWETLPTFTN
jgi:cytochrome P450